MITNVGSGTNQYMIVDDEPLFHTGLRRSFPLVQEAIGTVMPIDPSLRTRSKVAQVQLSGMVPEGLSPR